MNNFRLKTWNLGIVLIATVVAGIWLSFLWRDSNTYSPAYAQIQKPGEQLPPVVSQVILVIVDGLRHDMTEGMQCLQALKRNGASAKSTAVLPSVSQPAWTTLISGARPEISGATLTNARFEEIEPIRLDHLFQLAKEANLTTAIAGQLWWKMLVPETYLDSFHFVETFDEAGDRESTGALINILESKDPNFLLLYLGEYDDISHKFGAVGPEAIDSIKRTDNNLCSLLRHVDLEETVVIVTSDHGELARGGHGGGEKVVLETPFVMAGPKVNVGAYSPIEQPDIAMTIAGLLGMRLPRSGQGQIAYKFLDVPESSEALGKSHLVKQQILFADAYLRSINAAPLSNRLIERDGQIERFLNDDRFEAAVRMADDLLDAIEIHIEEERSGKLFESRIRRIPVGIFGFAIVITTLFLNWRRDLIAPLISSFAAVGSYHIFYILIGYEYSFSTLGQVGLFMRFFATVAGGAILAFSVGLVLMWGGSIRRTRKGITLHPVSVQLSALCAGFASLLFMQALVPYVANGRVGSWSFIDPTMSFLIPFGLMQTLLIGIISISVLIAFSMTKYFGRKTGVQN